MADDVTITFEVKFAWWVKPYLSVLCFFCMLHRQLPDEKRLTRVLARATRIRVVR